MAIKTTQVTVGTTASLLFTFTHEGQEVLISVPSGGSTVFVGGSDVTKDSTTGGLHVSPGAVATRIRGIPGEVVYGVVASSTQVVGVLYNGG